MAQRFGEAEIGGEGAVPVEETLAVIPQGKGAIEPFQCAAQAPFGGLDPVFSLLAVRNVEEDPAEQLAIFGVRSRTAHLDPAERWLCQAAAVSEILWLGGRSKIFEKS